MHFRCLLLSHSSNPASIPGKFWSNLFLVLRVFPPPSSNIFISMNYWVMCGGWCKVKGVTISKRVEEIAWEKRNKQGEKKMLGGKWARTLPHVFLFVNPLLPETHHKYLHLQYSPKPLSWGSCFFDMYWFLTAYACAKWITCLVSFRALCDICVFRAEELKHRERGWVWCAPLCPDHHPMIKYNGKILF